MVRGVRLYDYMRQNAKSIKQDFNFYAPRFNIWGEWYDNVVFNGKMIRGIDTEFMAKWKGVSNMLQEFNADYEINDDNLFIGKYDDFYQNIDNGAFLISPNEVFNLSYNDRYAFNRFYFG